VAQLKMRVPFSYLDRQFAEIDAYLDDIRALVKTGDFTLGKALTEFEGRFEKMSLMPHAVGVGSGTDALILSLRALGVGPGDEVITSPNTFIATVGAIAMTGARPVFSDSDDGFTMDASKLEAAITPRTKVIIPVHYSGNVGDMDAIAKIAAEHDVKIVEDACQAIAAERDGKRVGSWGHSVCFSLHPLKNLNVWGDGGMVVTRFPEVAERIRLLRNHGLSGRDDVVIFGQNSRLDTLQAVVGNRLIDQTQFITDQRIANAAFYDEALADLKDVVHVPHRRPNVKHVYHLYMLRVEQRDALLAHLVENGVGAKVHYPIPVHLQPAAGYLGYTPGDFPVAENDGKTLISLPAHQHLTREALEYVAGQVHEFYRA
jgi:dTDP-3-amino-2,3,6-trideoxy-4-keto-D-glucose/dTDP-3-amino-3,4,6-trideoxy-alpha-D-glucose/dTDP-2,6-dideoxy-D-kanosamine transaminase